LNNIKQYENKNKNSQWITRELTEKEKQKYSTPENNTVLKIDTELRDLLPALTEEEFRKLEERILKDGCLIPLFIWNGYIADGHNRYNICQKYGVPFQTQELIYETKSEVMHWMIDGQLGRRNLSKIQRITVAEKYRERLKEEAKERQAEFKGNQHTKVESTPKGGNSKKGETSKELAKLAEVGSGTMARYEYVMNNGNEDLKKKMLNNEIPITAAYDSLKQSQNKVKQEQLKEKVDEEDFDNKPFTDDFVEDVKPTKSKTKKCIKCGIEKDVEDFYIGHDKCKECEQLKSEIKTIKKENDEIDAIISEVKTSRMLNDYFNVGSELEIVEMVCEDLIEQLNIKFFTTYDLVNKMDNDELDLAISVLDEHIYKINNIKLKLKGDK